MFKPEILVAARWWSQQLQQPDDSTTGDGTNDAMVDWARAKLPRLTAEQVRSFEVALADEIEAYFSAHGVPWDEDNPRFGAYIRACPVNDPCINAAAARAGISGIDIRLPQKTTMWIDPGSVRVAVGYQTEPVEVWSNRPDEAQMAKRPPSLPADDLHAIAKIVREIRHSWHSFAPGLIGDLYRVMELTAEERQQVEKLAAQRD